jgi:riboflavin synthase
MFTGLIEEVGRVVAVRGHGPRTRLQITAPHTAKKIRSGESVAVNGCCLTLSAHRGDQLTFDLLKETLDRTNLKLLRRQSRVNLERSLSPESLRGFGGHFVQGHIDCTSRIVAFKKSGGDHCLEIELPAQFAHYIVSKGSIAINGISLTVAEVLPKSFVVWIIPYTKRHTNLDRAQAGDLLNIEFDILAKYVERMLSRYTAK